MATRRIICPRCGSNNFLGRPTCFRCGSSLPPPEELSAPELSGAARGVNGPSTAFAVSNPQISPVASVRPSVLKLVVVVVVIVAVVLVAFTVVRRYTTPSPQRATAELEALKDKLMRERGLMPDPSSDPTVDPLEAQARRELQRLQRRLEEQSPLAPGAPLTR